MNTSIFTSQSRLNEFTRNEAAELFVDACADIRSLISDLPKGPMIEKVIVGLRVAENALSAAARINESQRQIEILRDALELRRMSCQTDREQAEIDTLIQRLSQVVRFIDP